VNAVAVSAEDATLCNFCKHGASAVAPTLYHIGRVNKVAKLGAVLGGGVNVVKLQGASVVVVTARLATCASLDGVNGDAQSGSVSGACRTAGGVGKGGRGQKGCREARSGVFVHK